MSTLSRLLRAALQLRSAHAPIGAPALDGTGARADGIGAGRDGSGAGPLGWAGRLAGVAGGLCLASCLLPAAAAADPCPNAQFRTGYSARLPDCRAWEMVSPVDKANNDVFAAFRSTPDGSALAYSSFGGFAGTTTASFYNSGYVAKRSASGWVTTSETPETTAPNPSLATIAESMDFSDDLSTFFTTTDGPYNVNDQNNAADVYMRQPNGTVDWLSTPNPNVPDTLTGDSWYAGRSEDSSEVVIESLAQLAAAVPSGTRQVYEWSGGALTPISVLPGGGYDPAGAELGSGAAGTGDFGSPPERDAVSEDGSRIFFTGLTSPQELFMRNVTAGTTTEVSLSQKTGAVGDPAPDGATFQDAARDGSAVFFLSSDELTNDATTGGGLYEYNFNAPNPAEALTFLSPDAGDVSGAQVQGIVHVSNDGSYVYFVALGQLVSGDGTAGSPNLYLAHGGSVQFIATLAGNDSSDWGTSESYHTARVTPDGTHLLFQTSAQIGSYNNNNHVEIYLYDATANGGVGSLTCVSCRPDGTPAQGDASLIDQQTALTSTFFTPRNITDNGSEVFFDTTDSLVPQDINGQSDAYEWENGTLRLISLGSGPFASAYVDNSADGSDVFIRTRDALLPQDTDGGLYDVYDARVDGGFPTPVTPPLCSSATCQGPPSTQPSVPMAASVSFFGPGDVPSKAVVKKVAISARRTVTGSRFSVSVLVPGKGRITVSGAGLKTARKSVRHGGSYRLTISLTRKEHSALLNRHRRKLKVTVHVSYKPAMGSSSTATFSVTVKA